MFRCARPDDFKDQCGPVYHLAACSYLKVSLLYRAQTGIDDDQRVSGRFSQPDSLELMAGFQVESDELIFTGGLVLGIALAVSVVGASIAVTRYLDA